jgi:hypothetical protein
MNIKLRNEIVRHIIDNLGIINNQNSTIKSLRSDEFLLDKIISFEIDNKTINKNVYGCQMTFEHKDIKMLLGDCSTKNGLEFSVIIKIQDSPNYGLYLSFNDLESILAVSLNGIEWMQCNTYLQSTFLAGMEQVKDFGFPWKKCDKYDEEYEILTSFIKYSDLVLEERYSKDV